MSTLRDSLTVDPPVTLNANYRLDHVEISKIDDKIRACEEFLADSLLRGSVSTRFKIFQNTVNLALLKPGACVCLSGASDVLIDAATNATLAGSYNRIIGVLASTGVLGAFVSVVIDGVIPSFLSGLGAGSPGKVYVNGATARLTRTETFYPVGTCDAAGNVQLGGAGSSSSTSSAAHYVVTQADTALPNAHEASSTSSIAVSTANGTVSWDCVFGTTAGTVCSGNDSRLSDARACASILGSSLKSGATFSEGQALVLDDNAALVPAYVYSPYRMGEQGSIPFAGQDAAAGIQFLETALPGWQLSVSAAGIPEYSAGTRWRRTYFTSLDDSWSMAMTAESMRSPYPIPQIGLPIRIADKTPIVYGDTYGNYASIFSGISGTLSNYADHRGRIYPSLVSDGSGAFHVNFYSDARRTVLFGHTASFSAVGDVAFVADNGSGLSGTCAIAGTLTANSTAILQVFKYAILTGADFETHYIFWTGAAVGCPEALWIGDPELVRPLDITIQGAYAGVTSLQAIYDRTGTKCYCDFAAAHLVALQCIHGTADTTVAPKIAMVHAGVLTVSDANAFAVSTSRSNALPDFGVVDSTRCVESGQALELRVQKLGTGDARDLSAVAIYVLE